MKYLLLFSLFLVSFVHANKVLYLNYESTPDRVIKGEVFDITIKTISTIPHYKKIKYSFHNKIGVKVLNTTPHRKQKGKFFFDTFKFIATRSDARLPDIKARLIADREYQSTTLLGKRIKTISLNPQKDFSNIIASSLELIEYKTTSYDNKANIIVFTAQAKNGSLKTIKFENVIKQGVESLSKNNVTNPKVTYFVVIDKKLEKFSFTYFNTQKNKFQKITIPIIVDDDSVTTQTDLKPKDQSREQLKITLAAVILVLILILAIWRKQYIFLLISIIPIAYIVTMSIPAKDVCIKKGSNIYLLPIDNGTIFETTYNQYTLTKEGSVTNYTKVKLYNEKIGWVKNEDLCTP